MMINPNNPIIMIYADGTTFTNHCDVSKGFVALRHPVTKQRPVTILYHESVVDKVVLDKLKYGVNPISGQCLMYKTPVLLDYRNKNND